VNLYAANANGTNVANTGLGGATGGTIRQPIGGINPQFPPRTDVGANPTGSLPILGTLGTLIGAASGAAVPPFGSLLTSIIRTSSGGSVDLLVTALETKGLVRRLAEP